MNIFKLTIITLMVHIYRKQMLIPGDSTPDAVVGLEVVVGGDTSD